MAWDDLLARLFPPLPRGVHWGLEVTRGLLASVGNPHLQFPCIHIGGTNGKGSVAATCASILRASGRRVALYTSPHLCGFRERFQVDGRLVDEAVLAAAAAELRPAVERLNPSFFEATTALAFAAFAREQPDVVVVEVGLGGRLDATNVIVPLVCAITNVAMDHMEYLGSTLEAIAREKAGIIKAGVPVVTAEPDPVIREIFEGVARERGAPFRALDVALEVHDVLVSRAVTRLTLTTGAWGELRLSSPLLGPHQVANTALAALVLEALPEGLRPGADAVVRGVSEVRWPGRLQIERLGPTTWVFDVAHNTAGMHALAESLARLALPRPLVTVVGVLGDKDWRAMLPPLFTLSDAAILSQPRSAPDERRWDPGAVARAVPLPPVTEIVTELEAALARAVELAGAGTVVVTGSCYTVGDALVELDLAPYGAPEALPTSAGEV